MSAPQPFMYAFILKLFNIENSNDIVCSTNTVWSSDLQSSETMFSVIKREFTTSDVIYKKIYVYVYIVCRLQYYTIVLVKLEEIWEMVVML